MRVRDFIGLGPVWFLLLVVMFLTAGLWFGALGALFAAFLMTPLAAGSATKYKLAASQKLREGQALWGTCIPKWKDCNIE